MKVAWNLKGGGITGFTMAEDELPVSMMFTHLSSRVVVRRPVILYNFFGVT